MRIWCRTRFAAVAAATLWLYAAPVAAKPPDAFSLYGDNIQFDVLRGGENIGRHSVRFAENGEKLTVLSTVDLDLNFLAIFSYRYRYRSEAKWSAGQLDRLKADVDDDGEKFSLLALRTGPLMRIAFADQSYSAEAPLFPTNHWNAAVLGETRVLNTLTGRVNNVRLEPRAREPVATEMGDVMATRYAYTGDLETEVWYDDTGRWVKLRFLGRDGTPIEYTCRRCQGGRGPAGPP